MRGPHDVQPPSSDRAPDRPSRPARSDRPSPQLMTLLWPALTRAMGIPTCQVYGARRRHTSLWLTVLLLATSAAIPSWGSKALAQAPGTITTVAGTGEWGFAGDEGRATSAQLDLPSGVAFDASGNLFIADSCNSRIRKVAAGTGLITTVAGSGPAAVSDSPTQRTCGGGRGGDGGPATSARLVNPYALAFDPTGNLFIADTNGYYIRKLAAGTGLITTVAGSGWWGFAGDGGPATSAQLTSLEGVAVDASGNLFIADSYNHRIRRVAAGTGIITTVAGSGPVGGQGGFAGDGGPATSAQLWSPAGLAIDASGNLYMADVYNHRIRKVDSTGIITTVAGMGPTESFRACNDGGVGGDRGPATSAQLRCPHAVAFDSSGNLFIADAGNGRIRKVDARTGIITTVAGGGTAGLGDGGPATSAYLAYPKGLAIDPGGGSLHRRLL